MNDAPADFFSSTHLTLVERLTSDHPVQAQYRTPLHASPGPCLGCANVEVRHYTDDSRKSHVFAKYAVTPETTASASACETLLAFLTCKADHAGDVRFTTPDQKLVSPHDESGAYSWLCFTTRHPDLVNIYASYSGCHLS